MLAAEDVISDIDSIALQKQFYNAAGAAFATMKYSPEMKYGVFIEYRDSVDTRRWAAPFIENALAALVGASRFWMEDRLIKELHDAKREKRDPKFESCLGTAIEFLNDPEKFLDNVQARHKYLIEHCERLNKEIEEEREGNENTQVDSYAAIRTATDGSPNAAKPGPVDCVHPGVPMH
jgi:hypothetical protein